MATLPNVIKELLSSCMLFEHLAEDTQLSIAEKSQWIYLAKHQESDFIKQQGDALCIIHSGQFFVQYANQPGQYLSEGDIFGYMGESTQVTSIEVDLAGLILCIPRKLAEKLKQDKQTKQAFDALSKDFIKQESLQVNEMWMYKRLEDIVNQDIISVNANVSIYDAAKLMTQNKVSSVLVVSNNKLVGIVTDRDLRTRVLAQGLAPTSAVQEIMTHEPYRIERTRNAFDAMCLMNEHQIHHLPILDKNDERPCGIITATDLLKLQRNNLLYMIDAINKAIKQRQWYGYFVCFSHQCRYKLLVFEERDSSGLQGVEKQFIPGDKSYIQKNIKIENGFWRRCFYPMFCFTNRLVQWQSKFDITCHNVTWTFYHPTSIKTFTNICRHVRKVICLVACHF